MHPQESTREHGGRIGLANLCVEAGQRSSSSLLKPWSPPSTQVPRRQEKVENVRTEDSRNQFLQELETGQKVSGTGSSGSGHTPQLEHLERSSPPLTSLPTLQPKKPLVDNPVEKPSQPIEVRAAARWWGGGNGLEDKQRRIWGVLGPSVHRQKSHSKGSGSQFSVSRTLTYSAHKMCGYVHLDQNKSREWSVWTGAIRENS